jgi:antitoxin ParD1/3/4
MNISLPQTLKSFVDTQVSQRGYGTSSEYVREWIRKDQDRLQLRDLLLAGSASNPVAPADGSYFEGLRGRVRKAAKPAAKGVKRKPVIGREQANRDVDEAVALGFIDALLLQKIEDALPSEDQALEQYVRNRPAGCARQ